MSSPSASPSAQRQSGVEDTDAELRVFALAAARLAHEAGAVLQSQARLVEQVQRAAGVALTRIAHGGGTPAEILADVTKEILALRDLANLMKGADAQGEFCRPDIILDQVVSGASLRAARYGVTIDYVRSFSHFTMFGAPGALSSLMSRCIDAAVLHCSGGILSLRANFYDAHDGRRMLRLVIGAEGCGIKLSAAELKALAIGADAGSVAVNDGAMIVMVRAPLAAPARLFSVQADVEAHGV
jgi:hypothetical protein